MTVCFKVLMQSLKKSANELVSFKFSSVDLKCFDSKIISGNLNILHEL